RAGLAPAQDLRARGAAADASRRLRPAARPGDVDVGRFERLLADGRSANAAGKPGEALAELESALRLWRGGALADLAYETFARTEVERLEELRLVATEERVDAELALGRHDTLVSELQAL